MLLKALVSWELVSKLCSTLCDPMGCSPPGSSVHGIFQARILEWVAISSSGDLSNPGIKPRSPALQVVSLPTEPPGKAIIKGIRCSNLGSFGEQPCCHLQTGTRLSHTWLGVPQRGWAVCSAFHSARFMPGFGPLHTRAPGWR